MPTPNHRQSKFQNNYLGRKINETIVAMLNEMTVVTDNSADEDVTLAEILDRLTTRVNSSSEVIDQVVEQVDAITAGDTPLGGGSSVKFYPSISKFPTGSDAKSNVLIVCTSDYSLWCWDDNLSSYTPCKFQVTVADLTSEDINRVIKVINGGTASTVI